MRPKPTLAERTRAGAIFLDSAAPNWHRRVNPHTLDISHPCRCVLGQLMGEFWLGQATLNLTKETAIMYGLLRKTRNPKKSKGCYYILTMEWRERIAERVREDNVKIATKLQSRLLKKPAIATTLSAAVSILLLICI